MISNPFISESTDRGSIIDVESEADDSLGEMIKYKQEFLRNLHINSSKSSNALTNKSLVSKSKTVLCQTIGSKLNKEDTSSISSDDIKLPANQSQID